MRILVTGAKGFVGKNLIVHLKNRGYNNILEFDIDTPEEQLEIFTKECEFVFHLAGVNRPLDIAEFDKGNREVTCELLQMLLKNKNHCPVVFSSSIQAELDNPYGESKKAGEDEIFSYNKKTGTNSYIYRLPNVFGKWCRPNYNSAVATFCHNIANNLAINVNDPEVILNLVFIDDVVSEFISALEGQAHVNTDGFCYVPTTYKVKLGEIVNKLYDFKENRKTLVMPSLEDEFDKKLYGTYLSYLPKNEFSYTLDMKHDNRGWLAEFIKSKAMGQIFISKTKPGIARGNHWHHTKMEKFLVIQGKAVIKFRQIDSNEVIEYPVDGNKLEVLDIPAGYTHLIENTGTDDVITLFWAGEIFNPNKLDTYYLNVNNA